MSVMAIVDSITQNEASKVAYDYVMMLRNNKFDSMVCNLKHTTREKFWKQQQTEKKFWYEITAWTYIATSMTLNLNQNIKKIINGNPYFPCFSWFLKNF